MDGRRIFGRRERPLELRLRFVRVLAKLVVDALLDEEGIFNNLDEPLRNGPMMSGTLETRKLVMIRWFRVWKLEVLLITNSTLVASKSMKVSTNNR